MHTFRVWATVPKKVEVQVGARVFPMHQAEDGWWSAKVADAKPGDEYGFRLDGEGPFPDPRSACQPNGVHGLSQLVDHKRFRWSDARWEAPPLSKAVIYELHIGTFTPAGTFFSAIDKLDHLIALGVTHVELMPVNEYSGNHGWGYDGVDLYAPHHAYGRPEDLKKLVDACHTRGLAVLLDVVYNHLGPSGNYLAKFGAYFSTRYTAPWGAALNFDDAHSDEVRRFFCDNALMWLRDFHFDGLRIDAVHAIFDTSACHFLAQLESEVADLEKHLGRRLVLIPESDLNDPRLLLPREQGGYQLDAQWSDDFHHALHTVLTGEKNGYYSDFGQLEQLATALKRAFVYTGEYSSHRRRRHGQTIGKLSGHRFLGYLQNHDQIGNRAQGERSGKLMNLGRLKIGAALVLTSPFVPMLFQGEEWGASTPFLFFTDHQEPDLAQAVREGRCREFVAFGWKPDEVPDPQARENFERSKLNWPEISLAPHAELLNWHKQLIQLRRQEPSLRDGRLDRVHVRFDERKRWLVAERGAFRVVCNFLDRSQTILAGSGKMKALLYSEPGYQHVRNQVKLPPNSVVILRRQYPG